MQSVEKDDVFSPFLKYIECINIKAYQRNLANAIASKRAGFSKVIFFIVSVFIYFLPKSKMMVIFLPQSHN